jgi:hypothetical protein
MPLISLAAAYNLPVWAGNFKRFPPDGGKYRKENFYEETFITCGGSHISADGSRLRLIQHCPLAGNNHKRDTEFA